MKRSKYRNQKTVVDGITFDSKREAHRYGELLLMLRAGVITELVLQKRYTIVLAGHHICDYIADFVYYENYLLVVEDAKGFRTPEYQLKKKLMLAVCGIEIREV